MRLIHIQPVESCELFHFFSLATRFAKHCLLVFALDFLNSLQTWNKLEIHLANLVLGRLVLTHSSPKQQVLVIPASRMN